MVEVEIRARIKDISSIKQKLTRIGATFVKKEKQIDKVYGRTKDLDSETKIIEGRFSARIRQVDNKVKVEFKEIRRSGVGLEISSEVPTIEQGAEFLSSLDFNEAFTISKTREFYKFESFELALDEVDELGTYLEIELEEESGINKQEAIDECIALLKKIDPEAEIETKKYGDLMQDIINSRK